MRIDQVVVGAREGDAITQIAMNMQSVLAGFGTAGLFARFIDPSVAGRVEPLSAMAERVQSSDIVVFHASIGDGEVWDQIEAHPGRVWIVYHNITPAELFADDPAFMALLVQGREQLAALVPRVERVLTVSEFNRADLATFGVLDVEVLSGMIDPYRLERQPADLTFGRSVEHRAPGPMVLFAGQLMPHKRPELLISALHLLVSHSDPNITLVLAGHHPSASFARSVAGFIAQLGLSDRVWLTGGLTDVQLAEIYRRADVMVTASQHEGLCLPVVEAMAMSVPVVSSAHAALPETVGPCGIVVPEDEPEWYAEAILMALEPERRARLTLNGRARARSMSIDHTAPVFASIVSDWLGTTS